MSTGSRFEYGGRACDSSAGSRFEYGGRACTLSEGSKVHERRGESVTGTRHSTRVRGRDGAKPRLSCDRKAGPRGRRDPCGSSWVTPDWGGGGPLRTPPRGLPRGRRTDGPSDRVGKPHAPVTLGGWRKPPRGGAGDPSRASRRPGSGSPSGSGESREPQTGSRGALPVAASMDRRGRIAEAEV